MSQGERFGGGGGGGREYLRVKVADIGSCVLVALGGVLAEEVSSDTRSNSSCHRL